MSKKKKPSAAQALRVTETKDQELRTIEASVSIPLEGSSLSDELAKTRKIPSLQERLEVAIMQAIEEHQTAGLKYISDLEKRAGV